MTCPATEWRVQVRNLHFSHPGIVTPTSNMYWLGVLIPLLFACDIFFIDVRISLFYLFWRLISSSAEIRSDTNLPEGKNGLVAVAEVGHLLLCWIHTAALAFISCATVTFLPRAKDRDWVSRVKPGTALGTWCLLNACSSCSDSDLQHWFPHSGFRDSEAAAFLKCCDCILGGE